MLRSSVPICALKVLQKQSLSLAYVAYSVNVAGFVSSFCLPLTFLLYSFSVCLFTLV